MGNILDDIVVYKEEDVDKIKLVNENMAIAGNNIVFSYDHKKAIEEEEDNKNYLSVRTNPNKYLSNILNIFDYNSYVFATDGIIRRADEIIKLEDTDSIIIEYKFKECNNIYCKKILIKDQDKLLIIRNADNTILKIMKVGV